MPDASIRTIAFMNQKGGVGKTTTAVSLAAAFAALGQRTLLIDLDPQAHASLHLGIEEDGDRATVYDVLIDPANPIQSAIVHRSEHLDVLPAETDLAAAESELASDPGRHTRLRDALDAVKDNYDVIMLDCPPSLGLLTLNGLAIASEIVIPMQAHFLALQGVGKLLETVQHVCRGINPALRVSGVVLCVHDRQATHAQEVEADLREFFEASRGTGSPWDGAGVLEPPIRRNIKLAECPSFGQSIFEYAPLAAGAEDYSKLAEALVAIGESTSSESLSEQTPQQSADQRPEVIEPKPATGVAAIPPVPEGA